MTSRSRTGRCRKRSLSLLSRFPRRGEQDALLLSSGDCPPESLDFALNARAALVAVLEVAVIALRQLQNDVPFIEVLGRSCRVSSRPPGLPRFKFTRWIRMTASDSPSASSSKVTELGCRQDRKLVLRSGKRVLYEQHRMELKATPTFRRRSTSNSRISVPQAATVPFSLPFRSEISTAAAGSVTSDSYAPAYGP